MMAILAALPSYALDRQDEGEYILLNVRAEPTTLQMRFFQNGSQWMMDSKQNGDLWQPTCRATVECKLVVSSPHKSVQYRSYLSAQWQHYLFSCVENKAFAFCHAQDEEGNRAYWWFPLLAQKGRALPVNRLR